MSRKEHENVTFKQYLDYQILGIKVFLTLLTSVGHSSILRHFYFFSKMDLVGCTSLGTIGLLQHGHFHQSSVRGLPKHLVELFGIVRLKEKYDLGKAQNEFHFQTHIDGSFDI
jgi:hypothetical protein